MLIRCMSLFVSKHTNSKQRVYKKYSLHDSTMTTSKPAAAAAAADEKPTNSARYQANETIHMHTKQVACGGGTVFKCGTKRLYVTFGLKSNAIFLSWFRTLRRLHFVSQACLAQARWNFDMLYG